MLAHEIRLPYQRIILPLNTLIRHDRARIQISSNDETKNAKISNEIQDYIDCRYLSASETAWRIFELPLHGRSHSVERFPVHLPGENRKEKNLKQLQKNCDTKLTAFVELNKIDKEAKQIKYEDIPLQYRWMNNAKTCQKRKKCTAL
ncbi:uncharacterized protein B4U80_11335, partial [Leptotrombidium deliense]